MGSNQFAARAMPGTGKKPTCRTNGFLLEALELTELLDSSADVGVEGPGLGEFDCGFECGTEGPSKSDVRAWEFNRLRPAK